MASTNGIMSAPQNSDTSSTSMQSTKRKRDDDASLVLTNGISNSDGESNEQQAAATSKALIRDLIDVLKEHDTTPSILQYSIPEPPFSSGPQVKRQKAEDKESQRSILTRQSDDTYKNVDGVLEDIALAVSGIMEGLQMPSGNVRLSEYQSTVSVKVKAFQQLASALVEREKALQEGSVATGSKDELAPKYSTNGGAKLFTQINASAGDNKTVLTLFGGASGAKQMFSSLQIPAGDASAQKDIVQILREVGLPNGITTTQIVPVGDSAGDKKRVPTLGELFPTPASVPSLLPPKPSKIGTTRSGTTVGFYQPSANEPSTRNASYSRQAISRGKFIDYSNVTNSQGTKRKRDRALSLVGTKAPAEPETVESDAARLDALFRSAYSGFAPTRDDGAALAPAGMLSRTWWQKVGEENFEKMVENATSDTTADAVDPMDVTKTFSDLDLEVFEKMVEELENDGVDPSLVTLEAGPEKSAEEKDVEEILQGISELLETLNSYQRIRHMSLNSSSRPAGLLSAPDTTSLGTPSKPSESEQATYEILKSQLTLMIATLPPYAVAKLDSNRLAELSISAKIEVPLNDCKGVMEEDEAARLKALALTAASSASRIVPPNTGHRAPSVSYGNQYPTSRPGPLPPAHYYGNTQTPIRPPTGSLQRPPATAPVPNYQSQRPSAPAPVSYRNAAYGTPTNNYQSQVGRSTQQAYASAAQQYGSNSLGQSYMPQTQSYQHTQQALTGGQMNGRYSNHATYPQQTPTQQNGLQYRYGGGHNGGQFPRQTSPQKAIYSPQPASQPSAPYSTPTPSMPLHRNYAQAPMGQSQTINGSGSHSPAPAPQHQGSAGPTQPYATFMTQQQQTQLLDRQRNVLAIQQQQTQENARTAAMGGVSGGQVNGSSAVVAGL